MKILIVQTAFIGDCVLTTPLIRRSKEAFGEDSFIAVMTTPEGAQVFDGNPHIDEIIVYDKRNDNAKLSTHFGAVNDLLSRKFDIAILPHRSFRTGIMTFMARIPERIGFEKSGGTLFYTKKVSKPMELPEPERLLELLTVLGHNPNPSTLEVFPGAEREAKASELLKARNIDSKAFAAIAPGSVWGTKRYPPELFAEAIRGLFAEKVVEVAVIIGSAKDSELCDEVAKKAGDGAFAIAGESDILTSAEIIRRAKVFIGNDSGPAHLAAAVGTPVVVILGPTVPSFGFVPYGENVTVLEPAIELSCRPCSPHGKTECPRGDLACMVSIFPDRVIASATSAVSRSS
ncbi:MAG TPA: glycosyltransferase family 9 protein [candidate division Zixibacteria bacterium]|nr:glycosyltransferase family 9 protein [candidate division Zixibacteria bacterium]